MDKTLHKTQETLDSGVNRLHEGAVASTGDYQKADQLKAQHKVEENTKSAANRIEETLHRGVDKIADTFNPQRTPGQKLDHTINQAKH